MEHGLLALGAGALFFCCTFDKNTSNIHIIVVIVVIASMCLYIHCSDQNRPPPPRDGYASARSANMCQAPTPEVKAEASAGEKKPSSAQPAAAKPGFHFDNVPARPHDFAYTDKEMQKRRDEFVFRKVPTHPTSESRSRVLAAMYQELVDSSVKKDPALRPSGQKSDAEQCTPLRGLRTRDLV